MVYTGASQICFLCLLLICVIVQLLSGLLIKRLDNTYMFFHPSFREWLIRRDEGESNKFLCDLRSGHAGIAFRLSRVQSPLDAEKTLELGHHILKAHLYKNMTLHKYSSRDLQAHWVASSSEDVSAALCTLRNIYNPNVKVSFMLFQALNKKQRMCLPLAYSSTLINKIIEDLSQAFSRLYSSLFTYLLIRLYYCFDVKTVDVAVYFIFMYIC